MSRIQFTFHADLPDWLTRFRWKNVKGYFAYQLKPYRCVDCQKKMPFEHFSVDCTDVTFPMRTRLMVEYSTECVCPSCLQKRIKAAAAKPNFVTTQESESFNVSEHCDVCDQDKKAYKWIKMSDSPIDNVRFCINAWNHDHICLDCAHQALELGAMKPGIYDYYQERAWPINGRGLPVENGKVIFPKH